MKRILSVLLLIACARLSPLAAQTFAVLDNFDAYGNVGGSPLGNLIEGSDGRLYGMTALGGAESNGTVFAINRDGTGYVTMHSFPYGPVISDGELFGPPSAPETGNDGGLPSGGLIQADGGALFGTTPFGGLYGYGVIFRINLDGTGFALLHSFAGATDGSAPQSNLILGRDGRLYGTAPGGGPNGDGTVFAINVDGSGFTLLHAFTGSADGSSPTSLIQGSDGRIYGASGSGSAEDGTTVFAVNPDGTGFAVLANTGGYTGTSPLVQAGDGRLYGYASGGVDGNNGILFAVNTGGTGFVAIHRFTGGSDGSGCIGGLIQGSDGRLYGATFGGGADGNGGLFAVDTDGTNFSTLHDFSSLDGESSIGGLLMEGGTIYGLTEFGGTGDWGTFFVFGFAAPAFTTGPASQLALTGQAVTLSAVATGFPGFQWTFNGAPIPGATSATLTIANVTSSAAGTYAVIATSPAGTVTSGAATLTVNAAPVFSVSPVSVTIASGRSAAFCVGATGIPAPAYQWYLNGATAIPGATDPILLVQAATSANAGTYTCVATNSIAAVTSSPATLAVDAAGTPGYLFNISARGDVGLLSGDSGAGALFAGVGISGAGTKALLIRGVGPGLASEFPQLFSSSNVVSEPSVALLTAAVPPVMLAGNDIWGGTAPLTAAFAVTGAFSLPASSQDAALLANLPAANYNVQMMTAGAGAAPGIGLLEVYDADAGVPTAHIVNLSARDYVGTGGHILIGGFIVGGTDDETLLVRAVGQGLNDTFGLSQVLAQPVVTILSGSTAIYSNTNWGGDPTLASVMLTVGAYPLNPLHQDSALLVSLPPGEYTVEVSGVSGRTGSAAVEFYDVP